MPLPFGSRIALALAAGVAIAAGLVFGALPSPKPAGQTCPAKRPPDAFDMPGSRHTFWSAPPREDPFACMQAPIHRMWSAIVFVDSSHPDQARKHHFLKIRYRNARSGSRFRVRAFARNYELWVRKRKRPANFAATEWSEVLGAWNAVDFCWTVPREDADDELRLGANGLQADLKHLSSNGRQTVLENSGHGITLDTPMMSLGA